MIRALLLRSGVTDVPTRRIFGGRGRAWLDQVTLPEAADASLRRLVRLLDVVHAEVLAAEALVAQHAAADPIAVDLDRMVGVGPVLALTLRSEIGVITRFAGGAQLASYAGLVPRVAASADRYRTGRITKEGSPWLRWALVEAALHAMRRPDALGRWARQLAVRKGGAKARVALARRLCDEVVAIWPQGA